MDSGSYSLARAIEKIHVPNTIQEIILSRMDRLPEDVKMVLQLASVIGREFPARSERRRIFPLFSLPVPPCRFLWTHRFDASELR